MKKSIIFILSCLSVLTLTAQTIGEAFYIYRNDGQFNAFFRTEIDSIAYSNYDADGNWYEDVVTQRVYTQDSLYQIPLAAIDSVGFVQPETKYKEGVTRLDYNLLDYIIGADGLTLKLKPNTPSQLVPGNGDKLVLLEGCNALPCGFSGIVSSVQTGSSSIDVVCEQAYLEDLFDSFCNVSTFYGANTDEANAARDISVSGRHRVTYSPDDVVFSLGPYRISRTAEISQGIAFDGDLSLSGGTSFSVEVQPTLTIHTILILFEGQGTYFNYSITGDLRVTSQTSLYGGLSYNHDFDDLIASFPIPQTGNLVNFYINPGIFVCADATVASSITATQIYTFGSAFDYSSKGLNSVKPTIGGRLADSSVDMIGSLDGSLAGGTYLETGFNLLSREIAKVCLRGEMGGRFSGSFVLRNSDIDNASSETNLYEQLKSSNVEYSRFVNVSLQASVAYTGSGVTWELSEPIHTWNLVPEFSNTKLTQMPNSQTSAKAYTELSGDCLFPVNVGYKLLDEDNNEVADYDANARYTNTASYMEHTFAGLDEDKLSDYTVYPKVKVFGFDVLASPEAKMQLNSYPVTLSDFTVTNSQHDEGAFFHEGQCYDYRFDVTVTATLDEEAEGITEWGYAYQDPNGQIALIPLTQFGQTYTDSRYAYFRNGTPPFTCTLYGYVKYEGSNEPVYGEPHDYPLEYEISYTSCPDDNHPHMIDLGLPSGTKWACCNVGASTPEGYGNYYAWGETQPKSVYNWDTYQYGYYNIFDGDYSHLVNIGSDIAGTSYDAATANWGAPWRMPSLTQIQELLNNCFPIRTTQNGVKGWRFTGPNDGSIFLPAAGYCSGSFPDPSNTGSIGEYRSSSLCRSYPSSAYILYFTYYSGGPQSNIISDRSNGQSVRPVR